MEVKCRKRYFDALCRCIIIYTNACTTGYIQLGNEPRKRMLEWVMSHKLVKTDQQATKQNMMTLKNIKVNGRFNKVNQSIQRLLSSMA